MMTNSQCKSNRRRRGQALLLAVLLMVFVALLGASFVSVVVVNLNQTARVQDKEQARLAAQAALSFADSQLVGSAEGDKWRPETQNPPPAPGDPDYNFYYTPLDRVQGWARTVPRAAVDDEQRGEWDNASPAASLADDRAKLEFYKANYGARVWVKFPDPRQPVAASTLIFLLETHRVNTGDQRGMTQISAIGLAPDDPTVFERRSALKSGAAQNPLTGVARSVSNWDFERRSVPAAQVEALAGTALTLKKVGTPFPTEIGAFYVIIGDPIAALGVRGIAAASASAFDATNHTQTLTLTGVPAPLPAPGERVELAAGLGAPTRIDYDSDGILTPGVEETRFKPSESAAPGSLWVNGGLLCFGSVQLGLRSPRAAGNEASGVVRVSGLIGQDNSDTANHPAAIQAEIAYQNGGSTNTLPAEKLLSSDDAQFPFAAATVPAPEKNQLVSDGWSRLSGVPGAPGRSVQSFAPPDVFGDKNAARYRGLTKFSPPLPGAPDSASLFGGGEGIYLDNSQDRERIGSGAGAFRDMTQAEMVAMWLSPDSSAPTPAARNGVPALATDADKSLEEQHLRGWIGPDEFRARGALIELLPDNPNTFAPNDAAVAITLDARADGPTPDPAFPSDPPDNQGPVRRKTWQDPATGARQPGVYTRVFAWPQNGVIFGEGNLRVRGEAATAPRSLTVVSMRNITIEGSLSAGNRKVLLLARQNVVLNPTGVLARVEAQTLLTGPPVGKVLPVADGAAFLLGDWISIDGAAAPRRIASVAANTLTLSAPPPPGVIGNEAVRAVSDPLQSGRPRTDFGRIGGFDDVLQRRFRLPAGAPNAPLRLALRHSAERVTAWTLGADEASPAFNPNPLLGIKVVPPTGDPGPKTTIARAADKILDVTYTDAAGVPGRDVYPLPPGPMSQSDATAIHIADLRAAMLDPMTGRPAPAGPPPYNWSYTSPPLAPNFAGLPFFFLAGVGTRYDDFGAVVARRNLISSDFAIPLATSVEIALDGARSDLRGDRWNTALNDFESVRQFGFSPTHGAGLAPTDPATWEDVLTSDQGFYTMGRHTLDSRVLSTASSGPHSLALRFAVESGQSGDPPLQSYFSGATSLPAYRAARLRLENVGLNAAPDYQLETVSPGATLDVRAFVYAQQGSWIVIPGVAFDESVKSVRGVRGSYVETNDPPNGPDAGEFVDTAPPGFSDGDFADLDHDGVISRAEQVAPFRAGRYNYKINFSGAIMEHHTALVRDPDGAGPLSGAVAAWMDKWSTVKIDAGNWNGPGAGEAFRDDLSAANDDFGGIAYRFDDAAARGFFDLNGNGSADSGESVDEDSGFRPPVTPGLTES